MLKNTFQHIPVLVGPAAEMLVWNPSGLYVDGTLGGGGHSAAFLSRLDPSGQVIGFDKDVDAVAASKERFKDQSGHISIMHHDFMNIEE
ncbi:MAG: 16S rRNA (cytosine(1402)-N(4))-methyltransferase, partial [Candidatus Latescibacteria bacterium]|nr:16S rRNA (cytosine(1402)-N(4))-methyltransferase [Candidatus Latescibacterota bacterium]